MRVLAVIAAVSAHAAVVQVKDECERFAEIISVCGSMDNDSDNSEDCSTIASFCNEYDECDNLAIDDSGDVVMATSIPVGAPATPLTCQRAFQLLNPPFIADAEPQFALIDNTRSDETVSRTVVVDGASASVSVSTKPIRDAISMAAQSVLKTFPRVYVDPELLASIRDSVRLAATTHRRGLKKVSESRQMEKFRFAIRMVLDHVYRVEHMREARGAYLSAVAPVVHTMALVGYALGIDDSDLYLGVEDALVQIIYASPNDVGRWYLRVPHSVVYAFWSNQRVTTADWNRELMEAGVSPAPSEGQITMFGMEVDSDVDSIYGDDVEADVVGGSLQTLDHALSQLDRALGNSELWKTHMSLIQYYARSVLKILRYMHVHRFQASSVCNNHPNAIAELFRGSSPADRLALLSRCKEALPLELRVSAIQTVGASVSVPQVESRVSVDESNLVKSVLTGLRGLSKLSFAGRLVFAGYGGASVKDLFEKVVAELFDNPHSEIIGSSHIGGLVRTTVVTDDDDVHIALGRLLGLLMRETPNILRQVVSRARSDEDITTSLFFESKFVRAGFYDVFMEGDFERALIDTTDLFKILTATRLNWARPSTASVSLE